MKKIFTLLLAIAASLGTLFASNTQVDGIWYDFYSSSKTASVTYRGSSYYSYSNEYTGEVVIPASVTFNDEEYSVTSIGKNAFSGCTGLTSVTIPNSVTSIGNNAFYGCTGLTSVTIPNSVTSIGSSAFKNCSSLTSVTIPNSVTSIGSDAFYGCSGLTSVTIPNSVTSIGNSAFLDCTGFTSVTIGNSVTSIGSSAFKNCSSLTSVHISDLAVWCAISFGNYSANPLSYAHNLYLNETLVTDLVIPNSVTSIGNYAFDDCSSLTSVTIPNSVTSIGSSAFYGCTGLTSVTIPNSVTSIGSGAFYNVPNVVYSGSATGSPWGAISVNGYVDGYLVYSDDTRTTLITCSSSAQGEIVIPNSVTSIEEYTFSDCTGLTSVTIPNSVTSIGNYAFDGCSGLTSITIPNSVTSIGDYAFRDCSGLTSVTIGNSVTSIGDYAFSSCSSLTSVTIPNSVTSIGSDAFYGCSGLTSVTIGNSVTSIGDYAFSSCSGLTSVHISDLAVWCAISFGNYSANPLSYAHNLYLNETLVTDLVIPNSVTSIGNYAFYGCNGLTSVTIPNSVTSIGSSAFYGCTGLTSVTIPNSVTTIGMNAFYECTGLTSVTIGNSVTGIGSEAFRGCSNITSVVWNAKNCSRYDFGSQVGSFTFGDEVEVIPASICYGMNKLTSITIPNNVTSIGSSAFKNCSSLTSVTISNSVTSIGSSAFYGCSSLCKITFGEGLTSIGDYALRGCSKLDTVVWNVKNYTISSSTNTPFYYYNSSSTSNNFDIRYQIKSFTFGQNVETISAFLCSDMSQINSVIIPNSVTSIGENAFYLCTSLIIVINNSALDIVKGSTNHGYVAYYAREVYQGSDIVDDFVFSRKGDNDYVVAYTGNDSQVTLPANYRGGSYGVAAYLFYNNSTIKSITISNAVTSIGDYAFNGCSNLNAVYIGNSVISIGQSAFSSCLQLYKVIMLPNSVPAGINSAFDALVGRITYVGNTNYQSGYNVLGTQRVYPNLNSYFTVDGIVYALSNPSKRTCDIIDCDYSGATTEFTIANSVVYRNVTLSVDSININAFRNNQEMTKLTVNNMAGIGDYAFANCNNLYNVIIEDSVKNIGDYAFQSCSSLEEVTIRNKGNIGTQAFKGSSTQNPATYTISNVGAIGESAFANCTSIKNLTIDTCVTAIGQSAFENCSSLEDVIIKNNGDIGVQAFANCSKLQKARLGNQVSEINQSAFSNCVLLDSITMPNTITSLGASAFNNCQKLAYVKLSNQLTSIGQSAFAGCNILPELVIPKSVASIDNSTFQQCSALSVVSFEDGSTPISLGNNASNQGLFYDCPLDSVYIGRELTYSQTASYGYSPFYRSPSLRSVVISNFPTKVEANEFYGCTKLKSVFIGNGVQSIGDYAFSGCSSIDYFSFGSQVQTIGAEAFSDCVAMTRLYSYSLQPPTCGASALEDIDKWNCTLYIPQGTTNAYSAASQWMDFFFVEENEEGGDGIKYPISVEYDATMGTVSGAGIYNRGAEAVLIATPAVGYVFVKWEDGSTDPERHIDVYKSATYTATFEKTIPTAIEELHDDEQTGEVYDILGRPVSHPSQGIFIRNGKKVLIK